MSGNRLKPFEVVVGVWVLVLFLLVGVVFASPLVCSNPTTISTKLVEGIPAGIIALIVAGVGSGIAYNQLRVARAKFNLDLFEKRLECFRITLNVLGLCTYTVERMDELTDFYAVRAKAGFLFGPDIVEYLDDIEKKIVKVRWNIQMMNANRQVASIAPTAEARQALGQSTESLNKEQSDIVLGLMNGGEQCKAMFGRYMSFGEWH